MPLLSQCIGPSLQTVVRGCKPHATSARSANSHDFANNRRCAARHHHDEEGFDAALATSRVPPCSILNSTQMNGRSELQDA
jgi:hypothetical protein